MMSIQTALSALVRLEVRGRDSAGIEVFVTNHNLPFSALQGPRFNDAILRSGAIRDCGLHIAFVYKNAAEIGDLGDNTNIIRAAIRSDALLQDAMEPGPSAGAASRRRATGRGVLGRARRRHERRLHGAGRRGARHARQRRPLHSACPSPPARCRHSSLIPVFAH